MSSETFIAFLYMIRPMSTQDSSLRSEWHFHVVFCHFKRKFSCFCYSERAIPLFCHSERAFWARKNPNRESGVEVVEMFALFIYDSSNQHARFFTLVQDDISKLFFAILNLYSLFILFVLLSIF